MQCKSDKQHILRLSNQLDKTRVPLDFSQNAEMLDIVKILNDKHETDLEKIWQEATDKNGSEASDLLKHIWRKNTEDRR